MAKNFEEFKKDIEEGPVSEDMQLVSMQTEWEDLGSEELVGKLGEEEELEPKDTLAEEEAKRQWERDTEEGKTTESWWDRLRKIRKALQEESQEGKTAKRRREVGKYESEARRLQEQVSIAKAREDLRKHKGTKSQRFVQKVQSLKDIAGALDVKGTAGAGMRQGFKKMVPHAQMGQNIYSTNARALREIQTPRPDHSLYGFDTEKLKAISSPSRQTRLAQTTTQLPKGMDIKPRMGKEMVTLDISGLKPKAIQIEAPKKKAQPPYYKKQVRNIRKGMA